MKFLSTASTLSQTFKNAARVREILRVFVSHGFAELLHRMHLSQFLPSRYSENPKYSHLPIQARLRLSFEQLGPTFVKLGQLFATRPDILPESFIDEFEKLQDRVQSIPAEDVRRQIEQELGRPISEVFETFEEKPMAAASIAQVHGATLKDGQRVALKVQRPEIKKTIQNDISIILGLAQLLEKYVPESRIFNPKGIVEEFFRSISYELDFRIEANNMRRIRKNLAGHKKVVIPKVYAEHSTARLLVLERLDGTRFSDKEKRQQEGTNLTDIVNTGCEVFFHMVMHDGIFHGDFHGGNLFILPDNRIGLIDFGIVGRLSKRVRDSVMTMFIAIMNEDFDTLASEYIHLSQQTEPCELQVLQKDLMDLISPYIGMSLGEADAGRILLRSTAVAAKHHLKVPRELMLLFKSMVTIEGLGKGLDPNFDLLQVGTRLARSVMATRYSKEQLMKDFVVVGRDVQYLAETTPRLFKRFFRRWSQNDFVVETRSKSIEGLSREIGRLSRVLIAGSVSACLLVTGVTLLILNRPPQLWGYSWIGAVFILGALTNLLYTLRRHRTGKL